MATEYIKRQAALNIVCSDDCIDCPDGGCDKYRWIKRLPAADVVEVVRCRDCRYYPIEGTGGFDLKWPIDGYNCPFCADDEYYSAKPEEDGYCSMGKRRELND